MEGVLKLFCITYYEGNVLCCLGEIEITSKLLEKFSSNQFDFVN